MSPQQITYVKNELERGVDQITLQQTLFTAGYTAAQISTLIHAATQPEPAVPQAPTPSITPTPTPTPITPVTPIIPVTPITPITPITPTLTQTPTLAAATNPQPDSHVAEQGYLSRQAKPKRFKQRYVVLGVFAVLLIGLISITDFEGSFDFNLMEVTTTEQIRNPDGSVTVRKTSETVNFDGSREQQTENLVVPGAAVKQPGRDVANTAIVTNNQNENILTTITFNNDTYVLGLTEKSNLIDKGLADTARYEFYLPGEFDTSWTKRLTLIAFQKDGVSTINVNNDIASRLASGVVNSIEDSGGTVVSNKKYAKGEAGVGSLEHFVVIYTIDDSRRNVVEVGMIKLYVENNIAKMVEHFERVPFVVAGEPLEERLSAVISRNFIDTANVFVATKFEFPE